jgi:hypothetical protein
MRILTEVNVKSLTSTYRGLLRFSERGSTAASVCVATTLSAERHTATRATNTVPTAAALQAPRGVGSQALAVGFFEYEANIALDLTERYLKESKCCHE